MLDKRNLKRVCVLLLMGASLVARGQVSSVADAKRDLDSCRVHVVRSLPGSHEFASDFVEAMASDPDGSGERPQHGLGSYGGFKQ